MPLPTSARRRPLAGAGLVLAASLTLTACGQVRAADPVAGGATSGSSPAAAPSASPSTGGTSPYVEPGAGDGAPHHHENNGHRQEGEMSPAHARDAQREADRVRPVLERLWKRKQWDPPAVRAALLELGYEEERVAPDGRRLGGTLTVRSMFPRYRDGGYVTPEGALVAVRVHDDACVSGFVQKSNYEVRATGPYPETGCFEPPYAH
ncbi:hypothetical protein ACH4F6_24580 [Streptomyces sp. NPDC017936]|uniref:hypothetical protein n=1 Tax=Streptomyces sp. NPDC017936 TaxID=3365016 RepID=UPI00378F8D52